MLADAFSLVFVKSVPHSSAQHQNFAGELNEVVLSSEIAKFLSELNSFSAADPDGLRPHLLKAYFDALSLASYLLNTKSLDECAALSVEPSVVAPYSKCVQDEIH